MADDPRPSLGSPSIKSRVLGVMSGSRRQAHHSDSNGSNQGGGVHRPSPKQRRKSRREYDKARMQNLRLTGVLPMHARPLSSPAAQRRYSDPYARAQTASDDPPGRSSGGGRSASADSEVLDVRRPPDPPPPALSLADGRAASLAQPLAPRQPWTTSTEDALRELQTEAQFLAQLHESAGHLFRRRHRIWGLPPALLTVCMSTMSLVMGDVENSKKTRYAEASILLVVGLFNVVTNFFNFSQMSERHFQFASNFERVGAKVNQELRKPREFRRPVDVFVTEVQQTVDHLKEYQPNVPLSLIKIFQKHHSELQEIVIV